MFKFKMPSNPVKTRDDGTKEVGGQSAKEWFVSVGALLCLWIVQGCIFAGLLAIAQTVRDNGATFPLPSRTCLPGESGCDAVFDHLSGLCGTGTNPACNFTTSA